MTNDTYRIQASIAPVGPIYHIASRRAEQAARRGDAKTAASWLAIAERHLAMVHRIERREISRTRLDISLAEFPHRQKILSYRASYPRGI